MIIKINKKTNEVIEQDLLIDHRFGLPHSCYKVSDIPKKKEGYVLIFEDGKVVNKVDNRGKKYWGVDGKMDTIKTIEAILPEGATFKNPYLTLEKFNDVKLNLFFDSIHIKILYYFFKGGKLKIHREFLRTKDGKNKKEYEEKLSLMDEQISLFNRLDDYLIQLKNAGKKYEEINVFYEKIVSLKIPTNSEIVDGILENPFV